MPVKLHTADWSCALPISSSWWQSYSWKNELKTQLDRVLLHAHEVLNEDFQGDHDPLDMLERAIVLAAFCIRRMSEKKLVTDEYASSSRRVRSFPARSGSDFRPPYHGRAGGTAFQNYAFDQPEWIALKPTELANEIIHSSQLMVLGEENFAEDGFLIASDRNLKRRVLHLSFEEFSEYATSVLDDRVRFTSDSWDPDSGKVTSVRS